jgi:hypothetical protein
MGLFSKNKAKAVKTTSASSRNKTYYLRENQLSTKKDFSNIFELSPEDKSFKGKINTEISVAGIPLSEITPERVIEELDSPSFVLDNSDEVPGHIVYYYRQTADLIKFLIQFHFINDKCIFVNNSISATGISLTNEDKIKVLNKLFLLYKIKEKREENNFLIFLTDPFGNIIYTNDTVNLYINYVARPETLEFAKKYINENQTEEINKDEFDDALGKFL